MTIGAFVTLKDIAKRWNGQLGVEGVSLEIAEGSFVALLGPSGCGKSTTLRLLSGLEIPDEGQIIIDGKDVTKSAASDRNLSMVFQSYALFPHLSVAENVMFGLKVRRVPKAERLEKLHRALEITGLLGFEARKPAELSGGQRQRVALARAIVAGKPVCLMDEPLSNLDAKLRNSVRKDIKKLQLIRSIEWRCQSAMACIASVGSLAEIVAFFAALRAVWVASWRRANQCLVKVSASFSNFS